MIEVVVEVPKGLNNCGVHIEYLGHYVDTIVADHLPFKTSIIKIKTITTTVANTIITTIMTYYCYSY